MGFPGYEDESLLWLFHVEIISLMKRTFWFKICICSPLVLISKLFPEALDFVYYISVIPASSNLSQSQCCMFCQKSPKTLADLELASTGSKGSEVPKEHLPSGFSKLFIVPYLHVCT